MAVSVGTYQNNPGDFLTLNGQPWKGLTTPTVNPGYQAFTSMPLGVRALAVDLQTAVGNGYNTLITLVAHFLGNPVSNGQIVPNGANPNSQNYLTTVEKVTGLSANSKLTNADIANVANGIIKAEGSNVSPSDFASGISLAGLSSNTSSAGLSAGLTGGNPSSGGITIQQVQNLVPDTYQKMTVGLSGDVADNPAFDYTSITPGSGDFVSNSITGIASASKATSNAVSGAVSGVANSISGVAGAISGVQGFIANLFSVGNAERLVFVIIGLLLLAAGLFTLVKQYGPPLPPMPKVVPIPV
jgi:hypothetical protein